MANIRTSEQATSTAVLDSRGCPSFTHVIDFVRGELAGNQVVDFEAHLDSCEACFLMVAQIASAEDAGSASARKVWQDVAMKAVATWESSPMPSVDSQGRIGEYFGRYRLEDTLGRGGMGTVYRALDDASGTPVALKTVASATAHQLASLREEIAYLESIRHPGIIRILDHGLRDGTPWYTMPILDGETLEVRHDLVFGRNRKLRSSGIVKRVTHEHVQEVSERRSRWVDEVKLTYARLCEPVAHLHALGLVHCDLKPSNVFLQQNGPPILLDFGLLALARGTVSRESLQVTGALRGTLSYLAPEIIRGAIPDARADMYSLGCMLYESLSGRPPFETNNVRQLLDMHLGSPPVPLTSFAPDVLPDLVELVNKLLSKLPADRPRSVEEIAVALGAERPVHDVGRSARSRLFRPRLVGRDGTLRQLSELQREALAGRGALALISGESGIGKTFLASELAQGAARLGFDVIVGECRPIAALRRVAVHVAGDALEPLRPWLQSLADRCRVEPELTARLFESPLTVRLLATFEPSLSTLLEGDAPAEPDELPPQAARERILTALIDTIERAAWIRPLLLVFDDLQWADDLTLALLAALPERTFERRQLLVLGLRRRAEGSAQLDAVAEKPWVSTFPLDPLGDDAVDAMMKDMMAVAAPASVLQRARSAAAGNPFLAAEYLRTIAHLLDRADGAEGKAAELNLHHFPASIEELLQAKLPRGGDARLAVAACAVLGRECPLETLLEVTQLARPALDEGVALLVERHLVELVKDGSLRFVHDKVRETTYADLATDERAQLHRRAAETLLRQAPSDGRARANLLAHHCLAGGDLPLAVDYLEQAATQALERFAYADVVMYLEQALETTESAGLHVEKSRLAAWQRQIGDARQGLGDMPGSKAPLLRGLALLGKPLPRSTVGVVVGILTALARQTWQRMRPSVTVLSEAQALANIEAARVLDRLQRALYFGGEYGSLLLANLCTLNLPKASMPHQALALAYTSAGATAGLIPLPKLAETYFELAADVLAKEYDLEADTFRLNARGVYLFGLGRWEEAYRASEASATAASAARYPRRFEEAAGVHTLTAIAEGDLERAWEWNERALASAVPRADTQMLSWGWLNRLFIQIVRSEHDDARVTSASLASILEKISRPERIAAECLRSGLCFRLGDHAGALELIDRALALAKLERSISPVFETYSLIASVLEECIADPRWRSPRLERQLKATYGILRRVARTFPVGVPRSALHEGRRLRARGREQAAQAVWREGLARAKALGMRRDIQLLERILPASESGANQEPE